jgi:hypothetical protein
MRFGLSFWAKAMFLRILSVEGRVALAGGRYLVQIKGALKGKTSRLRDGLKDKT